MTVIYKIINIVNEKFYIGSARNFDIRKKTHLYTLRNNKHANEYLQLSFNKYGEINFKFQILEECKLEELISREQYYLDNLNPEYNICKVAYSRLGTKHSEETKRKIGLKSTGRNEAISKGHLGKKKDRYTIEQIIKANNKSVLQFNKNGDLIKEWDSIREASNSLKINHSCISNCCSGRHKTAGKFVWKLKNNN